MGLVSNAGVLHSIRHTKLLEEQNRLLAAILVQQQRTNLLLGATMGRDQT